eukprot:m.70489 g.70489  ORF g.70489 m.70489 type:complete len:143 (+) comp14302_c1_seq1:2038-2466(+)
MNKALLLRYTLLASVAYFCVMGLAHWCSWKYPLLFVYYDPQFWAYQDKIIAFCMTAYISLFYTAANNRAVVPAALFTLLCTVLGLAAINLSDDLSAASNNGPTTMYWAQTALFAVMWLWGVFLYYTDKVSAAAEGRPKPKRT